MFNVGEVQELLSITSELQLEVGDEGIMVRAVCAYNIDISLVRVDVL